MRLKPNNCIQFLSQSHYLIIPMVFSCSFYLHISPLYFLPLFLNHNAKFNNKIDAVNCFIFLWLSLANLSEYYTIVLYKGIITHYLFYVPKLYFQMPVCLSVCPFVRMLIISSGFQDGHNFLSSQKIYWFFVMIPLMKDIFTHHSQMFKPNRRQNLYVKMWEIFNYIHFIIPFVKYN